MLYRDALGNFLYFDSLGQLYPDTVEDYISNKYPDSTCLYNSIELQSYEYQTCTYHCINIIKHICEDPLMTAEQLLYSYLAEPHSIDEVNIINNVRELVAEFPQDIPSLWGLDFNPEDCLPYSHSLYHKTSPLHYVTQYIITRYHYRTDLTGSGEVS